MPQIPLKTYLFHLGLFLLTLFTTLMVGAELITGKIWTGWGMVPEEILLSWNQIWLGLPYGLGFITFLTFHEFGHYFTAVFHRVKTTLPFYIPLFIPVPGILNIGSLGAVISLREIPSSTRKFFDIGIAGPLAGFVISIFLLSYGLTHLPVKEDFILGIHPEFVETFDGVPTDAEMVAFIEQEEGQAYRIGTNLLMEVLKFLLVDDPKALPGDFELIHYPFLFVGYITLFFTALNLLPIGQLDGGHIIYGMFGKKTSGYISRMAVITLLLFGGTGYVNIRDLNEVSFFTMGLYIMFMIYMFTKILGTQTWRLPAAMTLILFMIQVMFKINFPEIEPNFIWLFYAWMVTRFVKLDHPAALHEHIVNRPRKILGWVAIAIFILCFTPNPIEVVGGQEITTFDELFQSFTGSANP
jgi:membrane-associated protease RseP (regulator of RpoE activity)